MKKRNILLLSIFILGSIFSYFLSGKKDERVVGVIVPMEHQALKEIVQGFSRELLSQEKAVKIKVMNAQGDPNIQKAIIQQLVREKCDLLVPIGTAASQMTANLAKSSKIICLATDFHGDDKLTTSLNDELSVEDSFSFLHAAFPEMHTITLIHSVSEKVAKEIPYVLEAAKSQSIHVQRLMVYALSDLYTIGQAIAPASQAIFVLKDHLVVSGIQTLVQQAEKRKIPVITSDEGSILSGGGFALGVKEADIGKQGASLAHAILKGKMPGTLGPRTMQGSFHLFINAAACSRQGADISSLVRKAQERGLPIVYINDADR